MDLTLDRVAPEAVGQPQEITLMRAPFLLDTSVFRATPGAKLAGLAKDGKLLTSPFCFWELLTHLDEEGEFRRIKGNLMKFRNVSVLDDPWASVEREVVRPGDSVHDRATDSSIIYGILAALRDSSTVAEFYAKNARDDRDQVRQITGCVGRARYNLEDRERQFQEYVRKIVAVVRDGRVSLATPLDRHQGTLQVAEAWRIQLGHRMDQSTRAPDRLVRQTYAYSSFVLQIAADCVSRTAEVERNDFEDAQFCQHLSLDTEVTGVTADGKLLRCLSGTLADLAEIADDSFRPRFRVAGVAEIGNGA